MNNKEKKLTIVLGLIFGILVLTIGVSYALFTFNRVSKNSSLVVGDIYMHYNETNQIKIENAMPSDTYTNDYFEFTIDGKNTTTNKDIWYEIVLNHGDNHETRTERIKDNLLMFRLTEVNDNIETEIFTNKSFNNLENKRIYVNTINKNTTSVVVHTYRLYMWVSNKTKIGNTKDVDYDTNTWNNQVYGSIKINVLGDFEEKTITTDETCFTYQEIDGGIEITDYDATCGTDVVIPDTINNLDVISITGAEERIGDIVIPTGGFSRKGITSAILPKKLTKIGKNAFNTNKLESIEIPDSVISIGQSAFFVNKITNIVIPDSTISIGMFAFNSNEAETLILGNSLTTIGDGDFKRNKLTSLVFPNSITSIGNSAFIENLLTNVEIPNSVNSIGNYAFSNNQLTNIVIPDSVISIGDSAFYKEDTSNPNLVKITINKTCSDIKNIQASSTDSTKYYPWLSSVKPYTATGVTIYGSNNEICDTY